MSTGGLAARTAVVGLLMASQPLGGQVMPSGDGSLPAPEPSLAAVRENLAAAQERENRFAYKEQRTDLHMNPFGRLGTGATRVYEVTPAADGSSVQRRLIERDGVPVSDSPVEQIGRGRRSRVSGRNRLDDVTGVLQFRLDRREMLDGHSAIVVRFSPKPSAKPRTREGRIAQSLEGQIWINEAEREVARVEARAVEPISFGYGLLARLAEGTTISLVRQPVGDLWIPTSVRLNGTGRAMLVRKLTVNFSVDWFDYRAMAP